MLSKASRGTLSAVPPAALIIAGIDEAGYGPRLGPLCVGMSMFALSREGGPAPSQAGVAPNLWAMLRTAVGRDVKCARRGRLAIADSKKLKGAGGSRIDPLLHLERGVLAFESLARGGEIADMESALLSAVGVRLCDAPPWYAGDAILPRATTPAVLGVLRAQLASACDAAGVRPKLVRCAIVDERAFNERFDRLRNKASVSFALVAGMLRRLWETTAAEAAENRGEVLVCIDRQGGRAYYAELLSRALEGARVAPIEETEAVSAYSVAEGSAGRRMRVEFRVDAEDEHLPVALASMTAKYVRELLMARFNAYWSSRVRGLRPTAGYGTDAGRWLRDARTALDRRMVERLVRKA